MQLGLCPKLEWTIPTKVGTCFKMCPDGEAHNRSRYNQVHALERNPDDPSDTSLLIKTYCHTVGDIAREPEYLRNREGIARIMGRLRVIMDRTDVPFQTRASFILDRYHGISKDMSIQNWTDLFGVTVLEEIARFLIFADFEVTRLDEQTSSLTYQDTYNPERGIQLLTQCCGTLSDLYEETRSGGQPCPNEFEFRVYHLLLQMTPALGRDMLHAGIELVKQKFPMEFVEPHGEKVQLLKSLQEALKGQKWDEITDRVWQMDFFEFALGRRIMRRFREVKLHKFYTDLRKNNKQEETPSMLMEDFCEWFFLDRQGGIEFAKTYRMPIVRDQNNALRVAINEGYIKPKLPPPDLGCGMPEFAYIAGKIAVSDFINQHPTIPEKKQLNFPCRQLMWPAYIDGMREMVALHHRYQTTDYEAILVQQEHWHKYIRLEMFGEIPREKCGDSTGNEGRSPHPTLHWFRQVVIKQPQEPPTAVRVEKPEENQQEEPPSQERAIPSSQPRTASPLASTDAAPDSSLPDGSALEPAQSAIVTREEIPEDTRNKRRRRTAPSITEIEEELPSQEQAIPSSQAPPVSPLAPTNAALDSPLPDSSALEPAQSAIAAREEIAEDDTSRPRRRTAPPITEIEEEDAMDSDQDGRVQLVAISAREGDEGPPSGPQESTSRKKKTREPATETEDDTTEDTERPDEQRAKKKQRPLKPDDVYGEECSEDAIRGGQELANTKVDQVDFGAQSEEAEDEGHQITPHLSP